MKRELRCACHGELLGYEVTPGDDNTGPVTDPPRFQTLYEMTGEYVVPIESQFGQPGLSQP